MEAHHLFQGDGEVCNTMEDQDYVDDINTVLGDPEEMLIIDSVFENFERMSGAILNRSPV